MAFNPLQGFQSNVAAILLNTATQMALPAADVNYIAANLGAGNFTIFGISDGVHFEIVNVTGVTGGAVNITRGQEGTIARTFGVGAVVRFIWTTIGIQAVAGPGASTIVTGSGAAVVTPIVGGYNVNVTAPTFAAGTGISLSGTYPGTITITNTAPATPGPPTIVTGSGAAAVTPIVGGYNVNVPLTVITAGSGIAVTGTYPNFTITNTQTPGGTGTVTLVSAGPGIAVTGTPAVNPIIGIANTGVAAGTYGGITVNAQGQITAIGAGLITSVTSLTTCLVVGTPAIGSVTLTINSATTATAGIVKLAAATAAASNNAGDTTSAVTPGGVNAVLAALVGTQVAVFGTQSPLPAANYTTPVPGLSTAVTVASGKKAVISIYVEVYDTMTPTNIPSFAIGIFNGATLLEGVQVIPSAIRSIDTLITGPFTGTISVNTTTLGGTEAVSSSYGTIVYT